MTEACPAPAGHAEPHGGGMATRLNWLRAAVLGANDGVVSTAGLVVGVAGATSSATAILTAGLAGLFAGALTMSSGEYVSVSSPRDSERALLRLERRELAETPDAELGELAGLYQTKGLTPAWPGRSLGSSPPTTRSRSTPRPRWGSTQRRSPAPGTPPRPASPPSPPARSCPCWPSPSPQQQCGSRSLPLLCSPRSPRPERSAPHWARRHTDRQ